jgi:hypothetical protein
VAAIGVMLSMLSVGLTGWQHMLHVLADLVWFVGEETMGFTNLSGAVAGTFSL